MVTLLLYQDSPGSRYHPRHHLSTRHHMGTNYYNRTKRKRDSSSCSNHGHHGAPSCQDQGVPVVPLPPWSDPDYPYSRGIIGWVHRVRQSESTRQYVLI